VTPHWRRPWRGLREKPTDDDWSGQFSFTPMRFVPGHGWALDYDLSDDGDEAAVVAAIKALVTP